jgi:integrase
MARVLNRLSEVAVRGKKRPGYSADGGGLYLRVAVGGSKGWIFRFSRNGRTRDAGLGPYPAVTLVRAREEAERCRRLVAAGIDPIDARQQERERARVASAKATTFEQCANAFLASRELGWKSAGYSAQWRSILRHYVNPVVGALPVHTVDTGLLLKVVEPIWGEKPEMANRVRAVIESILNWAKARGHRAGENPAAWRGHLDQLLPARSKVRRPQHHPALPYADMPAFMEQLRGRDAIAARALEFIILTASRPGEGLGVPWAEIDLDSKTWTVPARRMKSGREHRVPLSRRAMAIVTEMAEIRLNDFVFPGMKEGRAMSEMGPRFLLRSLRPGVTRHGFRSTFRDWAAETTNFPNHVVEMALAHMVGDRVEAAYRRGDLFEKRRRLMEAWAGYCARAPESAKVLPLRQRAQTP